MPTKVQQISHIFNGGWATDNGPYATVFPNEAGIVKIPFLRDAENCLYQFDGGPRKIGGTTRLNSTAVTGSEQIRGLVDYWRHATSGTPTQKRVIHAGTIVFKEDADGVFDSLDTGLENDKIPAYSTFDDVLIWSTDSSTDVPRKFDQSSVSNLGTNTPNFAFHTVHKARLWASGNVAAPSTLYFSPFVNPDGDWAGAGAGTLLIDPNDGDRIIGVASHKDELWVFKGPHKGSIHRIAGSAPTGPDSFRRKTFITGLGCGAHNSIFTFGNDLGFMNFDGTIHSLQSTDTFGNFRTAALSAPINRFLRARLNKTQIRKVWAANDVDGGRVYFTIPIDNATDPNVMLTMDYRFNPVRWTFLNFFTTGKEAYSVASVIDATNTNTPTIMVGGNDGFVRKMDQESRSLDDSGSISYKVVTPAMDYGVPLNKKVMRNAGLNIQPKGNFDITFGWTRDEGAPQSFTVNQGGGDVLGTATAHEFILNSSKLGGAPFAMRYMKLEEGGEFRQVSYKISNAVPDEDVELHGISVGINRGSDSLENP